LSKAVILLHRRRLCGSGRGHIGSWGCDAGFVAVGNNGVGGLHQFGAIKGEEACNRNFIDEYRLRL